MLVTDRVAPEFTLPTLDGTQVSRSDYRHRHRNLALVFLPEAPDEGWVNLLKGLAAAYGDLQRVNADALAILPLPMPDAAAFTEELELPFPIAVDERGHVADQYEAREGRVIVLDHFGAPEEVWEPGVVPPATDLIAAAERSELACPECGVSTWPAER